MNSCKQELLNICNELNISPCSPDAAVARVREVKEALVLITDVLENIPLMADQPERDKAARAVVQARAILKKVK
jgi:hypothetical protein